MPSYLHPGVYVEEISSGSKPIEGVGTSTAAFVGTATKGPVGKAELVQSFDDYNNQYGDIASENDAMGLAVQSFYLNGGKSAFICRLAGDGSSASLSSVNGQGTGSDPVITVTASSEGVWGDGVYFRVNKPDQDALVFDLEIGHQTKNKFVLDEVFENLSMRAEDSNYALLQVNGNSAYVTLSLADAADPDDAAEQYQAATLTGGELDSSNAAYFNANMSGEMSLTLNINGLGAEQITIDVPSLSLSPPASANHDSDGGKVATAIRDSVRALSLDAPHQAFDCTYNTTSHRFVLTSAEDKSSASLEIYDGVLAGLLSIDSSKMAVLTGDGVANGATKFSSMGTGIPSLSAPLSLTLNIDGHGDFEVILDRDQITLIGKNAEDGNAVARTIQTVVRAYNREVPAYKDFKCTYVSNKFVLTSGSSSSQQSSLTVSTSPLAVFLKVFSNTPEMVPGRQIVQGTAQVIPVHDLGTQDEGVRLAGGSENPATANDFTDFYDSILRKVRDVSIMLVPGQHWADDGSGNPIISATLAHCEKMKSRVLIIDPPPGLELDQAATVTGLSLPASTYSVLYYPWVKVANPFYHAEKNPTADKTVPVAPSSFAAGMWSKTDGVRGVWKAPAGMGAGLRGAAGLEHIVEDGEQDQLNPLGVNCFRNMPGGGRVIWGARTLATKADPEWRYVPVRRTAIMIEQSLYNGIQWAVFEPNDHRLWSALRANIDNFMNGLFRAGAFQGQKASDAYFVRCGLDDTMTQAEIDAGQVIVVVGFAPLKPAEFVIVRIQQKVNQQ